MKIEMKPINSQEELQDILNHVFDPTAHNEEETVPASLEWLKCPVCKKGHFVLRNGKYGEFYGCNNYPTCRSTLSIKDVCVEALAQIGFHLYSWKDKCWKCSKEITLYSYFPEVDNTNLTELIKLQECKLGLIPKIDEYLADKYNDLKKRYSLKMETEYVANVCPYCNQIQGMNLAIEKKRKQMLQLTPLERDSLVVDHIPVGMIMSRKEIAELLGDV